MNFIDNNGLSYTVRKTLESDISEISRIDKDAFKESSWSQSIYISELKNGYTNLFSLVNTIQDNNVIGYIGYWKVLNEGHIITLAIDQCYRNLNLSDILLYTVISNSTRNSIDYLTLEVRASNEAAINLYIKHGFKQLGIRKHYYLNNKEDALVLWSPKLTADYLYSITESLKSKWEIILSDSR